MPYLPTALATRQMALALTLTFVALPLAAQAPGNSWHLRIPSGRMVATGDQRASIKDAPMIGVQLSRTIGSSLALTTTVGWARSRDLVRSESPRLNIWSGDIGLEHTVAPWQLGRGASFTPFVGLGGGARSYDSRAKSVDAITAATGYFAAGGELGIGRVGIRLEVRNHAIDMRGSAGLRHDVLLMGALRFNRHRTP
jgi:hypothetical protein